MVSMERHVGTIREIREADRVAVVEAGVVVQALQDAAEARGADVPALSFGARGTARVGGTLSTNAGGANVLRYGSARALCLGVEVVLADGRVLDLMGALHKDNSGYDLRDLFVGAEGTLGLITAAVVKLFPLPRARATAMVAAPVRGRGAAAAEPPPGRDRGPGRGVRIHASGLHVEAHLGDASREARAPFDEPHDVNILVEVGCDGGARRGARRGGPRPGGGASGGGAGRGAGGGARSRRRGGAIGGAAARDVGAARGRGRAGLRLGPRGRPRRGGALGMRRGVPGGGRRARARDRPARAQRQRGASGRRERALHGAVARSRRGLEGADRGGGRGRGAVPGRQLLRRARHRHAQARLDVAAQGQGGA